MVKNKQKSPIKPTEVVVVTGTPATGKTTIAKKLSLSLGYEYIDVNKLVKIHHIYDSVDKERDSLVVDTDKLNKYLILLINKTKTGLIIDSHLSHFLSSKYVDLCVVCKCDLKTLKQRLTKRSYSPSKIRENLDSEIFDICLRESEELNHTIFLADCTSKSSLNSSIDSIRNLLL
jgi:adenylate kinase